MRPIQTRMPAERQTLLTRAADAEARRQAARERHDIDAERRAESELRLLWRQWYDCDDS